MGINQFKNLGELDISGNLLTSEIPELKQLQFLKKLNLSNNSISELYPLPPNLEILNLSYNQLKHLNSEVTQQLKNLTTFDVSNNGLADLEGVQNLRRLKRLLARNNMISRLQPVGEIVALVEIDLENNPIEGGYSEVLGIMGNKKDLLVINLKLTPVIGGTVQTYEQLVHEICAVGGEEEQAEMFKKKMKFYANGCVYRSKRAYTKIKAMQ